eukprot:s673_g2.t1
MGRTSSYSTPDAEQKLHSQPRTCERITDWPAAQAQFEAINWMAERFQQSKLVPKNATARCFFNPNFRTLGAVKSCAAIPGFSGGCTDSPPCGSQPLSDSLQNLFIGRVRRGERTARFSSRQSDGDATMAPVG